MDTLSDDFADVGWDMIDLEDAFLVIDGGLEYMDEQGYL